MLTAYKYRLYPSVSQETAIRQHLGCARWVWNWALAQKTEAYEKHGERLSRFELQARLPAMKKDPATVWLAAVNSQSLQASLAHLDEAFTRFFKGQCKFPNFKSKKRRQSFACPQGVKVDWDVRQVYLPKVGWVKTKLSRFFEGKIKTCTVSVTPTGKFFVSILVDEDVELPAKPSITEITSVGIDLGIKDFAALSTGEKVASPRHLEASLKRLAVLQRRMSRRTKGGKRRERARIAVARQHEYIVNQRQDFLHKLTTRIVSEHDTVCLETLNIAGMLKNRHLARHIQGASWSEFVRMIEYKAERAGVNVLRIGQFEPSSRTCTCGHINNELTLADRTWKCPVCETEHDRDLLAASNIKRFALAEIQLSHTAGQAGRAQGVTTVG